MLLDLLIRSFDAIRNNCMSEYGLIERNEIMPIKSQLAQLSTINWWLYHRLFQSLVKVQELRVRVKIPELPRSRRTAVKKIKETYFKIKIPVSYTHLTLPTILLV